ncbi:hypothetical protein PG985_012677 [Apiospora marii]|uniref:uncharacterized protein n=1 Tax=Apiospora marii TaxID=335849 RepID=UPI00312D5C69
MEVVFLRWTPSISHITDKFCWCKAGSFFPLYPSHLSGSYILFRPFFSARFLPPTLLSQEGLQTAGILHSFTNRHRHTVHAQQGRKQYGSTPRLHARRSPPPRPEKTLVPRPEDHPREESSEHIHYCSCTPDGVSLSPGDPRCPPERCAVLAHRPEVVATADPPRSEEPVVAAVELSPEDGGLVEKRGVPFSEGVPLLPEDVPLLLPEGMPLLLSEGMPLLPEDVPLLAEGVALSEGVPLLPEGVPLLPEGMPLLPEDVPLSEGMPLLADGGLIEKRDVPFSEDVPLLLPEGMPLLLEGMPLLPEDVALLSEGMPLSEGVPLLSEGVPFLNPVVQGSLTDSGLVAPLVVGGKNKEARGVIPPHCGDPDAVSSPECPAPTRPACPPPPSTYGTVLPNSTVRMPALRAAQEDSSDNIANITNIENSYQGEQLQYDPTSMGFAIGIIVLISLFFAWLIFADISRKHSFTKYLRRRKANKSGTSSNEKGKAPTGPSASVMPFDAAAQMEGGHASPSASASEGETTLQNEPSSSRENFGAGPSSSAYSHNAVGAASSVTPRDPPRLPSL